MERSKDIEIKLLKTIIKNCGDGIFIADNNYQTIAYSDVYRQYLGASLKEMKEYSILDFYEKGWLSEIPLKGIIETKKEYSTIIHYYKTNKKILVTGIPIVYNEKLEYVILSFRDMLKLKKMEEELQQSYFLINEYRSKLKEDELEDVENGLWKYGLIYESDTMKKLLNSIESIAKYDSTILLLGETGVGKTLLARVIHNLSNRAKDGKFARIDCSCLPEQLMESELFGYEKGSFTGANYGGKKGLIEDANRGTLFLDEISEIPINLQSKLLTLLEEKSIKKIGGVNSKDLDVRIIAASNQNLKELVEKKEFRKDLFYRLNVFSIEIPPLRERKEDIIPLFKHFKRLFCDKYNINKEIDPIYYDFIVNNKWDGNVRELLNFTERFVLFDDKTVLNEISMWKVMGSKENDDNLKILPKINSTHCNGDKNLKNILDYTEREHIISIINESKTLKESAEKLQIDITTLHRKMKKYEITY
ncbi:MAG: sigma 54-interacting transcriptional regulator [Gudongella sp.]|nr:sigma 54-interacting transcriptional regulator [Gudongella sp.]